MNGRTFLTRFPKTNFSFSSLIFVSLKGANNDDVRVDERQDGSYTMETVLTAVFAACLAALLTGFLAGYACARRCTKSEDDNLPYPDTEYEYFEQRHNMNAWVPVDTLDIIRSGPFTLIFPSKFRGLYNIGTKKRFLYGVFIKTYFNYIFNFIVKRVIVFKQCWMYVQLLLNIE